MASRSCHRLLSLALLTALATSCATDGRLKLAYADRPIEVNGDWPVAAPEAAGLSSDVVRKVVEPVFDENRLPTARSFLIARNGLLVAEAYARSQSDRTTPRPLMSATKSVTSLLVGIALDKGLLKSVDQTLGELLPEKVQGKPEYAKITLRDLLTMRSGLAFPNDKFSLEMDFSSQADSLARILASPKRRDPGLVFNYQDADTHLAGAVVERAAGKSLDAFADEVLFAPLGITQKRWLSHRDGTSYAAYGLFLTPRDALRLGQLCLDRGMWKGQRIISEAWLDAATVPQVEPGEMMSHDGVKYGYFWWVAPDRGAYMARGHGGQYIYVHPAKKLVVVATAESNSDGKVSLSFKGLMDQLKPLEDAISD